MATSTRPENIGILAAEIYFPTRYVAQEELEAVDNCKGKYVVGLGQLNMAFVDDREDIGSIFLNAVSQLFQKYSIDPNTIGRVEIGTETLVDKSKSVKTSIMHLFGSNTDLEGVTSVNACYGGSAALFNSIAWLESSEWDGRYALVVCGDIAVYDVGPARPTGGCGAIALLLGPNAPLVLEPGIRASHALDVYDFYKPTHSEYATVDGRLSQWAYLSSVDTCYQGYKRKYAQKHPGSVPVTMDHFDYFAFHSPYNKLVQKGFTRIAFCDFMDHVRDLPAGALPNEKFSPLARFADVKREDSYESRDLETACRAISDPVFAEKVAPACVVNQNIGNMYTASVFGSLLSVIAGQGQALVGKRVMMFSYGSGSMATIYSFLGRETGSEFSIGRMQSVIDIFNRLNSRRRCSNEEFTAALALRAAKYGKAPMLPDGSIDNILAGAYYLQEVNGKHHRVYSQK